MKASPSKHTDLSILIQVSYEFKCGFKHQFFGTYRLMGFFGTMMTNEENEYIASFLETKKVTLLFIKFSLF